MHPTLFSIFLGSSIPFVINIGTFAIIRKIIVQSPEKAISANIAAFIIRLILYAVVLILIASLLEVVFSAFVLSFFVVFIFLQIGEALYFQRFFSSQKSDKTK